MKWEEYSDILFEKCKAKRTPYHASFEMTPLCNFECNMCYVRIGPENVKAQGGLLSTQEWLDIAKEAKAMGVTALEITGGEALTRGDFPVLYEAFAKMGFLMVIRTNGYLLKGSILELLKKYKPRMISITLYGASNETYKKVCNVPDGFSVVKENIQKLVNVDMLPRLTMTVTKDNQDDLPLVQSWAKSIGLTVQAFGGLINSTGVEKRSIDNLKIDFFEKESYNINDISFSDREVPNRERYMKPFWMCRGYGGNFSISWDGRMRLCNTLDVVWKDARAKGLRKAYQELYEDLDKIKRPQKCETCPIIDFCQSCPMNLYSETGNFEITNDNICNLTKQRYMRYLNKHNNAKGNDIPVVKDNCEEGE